MNYGAQHGAIKEVGGIALRSFDIRVDRRLIVDPHEKGLLRVHTYVTTKIRINVQFDFP